MKKARIAVVAGGYSAEWPVSLRSAAAIISWLDKSRYDPYLVCISRKEWVVYPSGQPDGSGLPVSRETFGFLPPGTQEFVRFDYAYITIHGTPGENGLLQGYLDMMQIPYNTGGVLVEALTFDKYATNRFLASFPDIRVARNILLEKGDPLPDAGEITAKLGLPVFVKPNSGGSSIATAKISRPEDLLPAVLEAFAEADDVLIESLITGTEVTCGCYQSADPGLARCNGLRTLPVTEVVSKNEFFDYEAKYEGAVEEITPARIGEALTETIQHLTSLIYRRLRAKGIIRIDYIITPDGIPVLLEVNTTPGMTATSFLPQQVSAAGLDMPTVLTDIITQSLGQNTERITN